jgi:pimeloyl-ACP methyl ester carboxylesterase
LSQVPTATIGSAGVVRLRAGRAVAFVAAGPDARVGPALAHLSLRALGLQRQTCAQAMIDDYLVCRRPWGFDPADLRLPVTLWHGRGDRLVPLAHTLALAAAIPGSEARVEAPRRPFLLQPQALPDPRIAVAQPDRRRGFGRRRAAAGGLTRGRAS